MFKAAKDRLARLSRVRGLPGALLTAKQVEGVECCRMKSQADRVSLMKGTCEECSPAVISPYSYQYRVKPARTLSLAHGLAMVYIGARGEVT